MDLCVFLTRVYFFFSINTFEETKHLLWQLLHQNIEKMLGWSMDLFRYLQMVFWKPFAVPQWAGFSQRSDWEEVAVPGFTVPSVPRSCYQERPECRLQRTAMIVPKVVTLNSLLTRTHPQAHHKSVSAPTDPGRMKHVFPVLPLTDKV